MDVSKFSKHEQVIIKAFEKNEFEKTGVRKTCRKLSEKHGYSPGTLIKTYSNMKKYGAFERLFPERFGIIIKKVNTYVPFATRLIIENIGKLESLAKHTGDAKQKVINDLIEEAHNNIE